MLNVQLVTVLEQPGVGEPDRLPGLDTQLENQPVRQVDEILVGHGQPTQGRTSVPAGLKVIVRAHDAKVRDRGA